jgi:hypothetical protein
MVPRDDLPPMPNDNSDPTLMPYRELFNEGINGGRSKYFPLGQTVNYKNDAFGAGSIGVTIILPFSRKATDKINVIFESAAPVFHCLNAGAPVWIGHPPERLGVRAVSFALHASALRSAPSLIWDSIGASGG